MIYVNIMLNKSKRGEVASASCTGFSEQNEVKKQGAMPTRGEGSATMFLRSDSYDKRDK